MSAYSRKEYQVNRRLVLEASGGRCQWPNCDRPARTADHIKPLRQGGTNDITNLRASCGNCNSKGGADITNELRRARRIGRRSRRW
jgi:5-methylcytosine-specific restriction endonuclease McrA